MHLFQIKGVNEAKQLTSFYADEMMLGKKHTGTPSG